MQITRCRPDPPAPSVSFIVWMAHKYFLSMKRSPISCTPLISFIFYFVVVKKVVFVVKNVVNIDVKVEEWSERVLDWSAEV